MDDSELGYEGVKETRNKSEVVRKRKKVVHR